MPFSTPLFPHGGVLGTAAGNTFGVVGIANVTADAFADIIQTPLFDFYGQKGIRNGRSRRTDKVEPSFFNLPQHGLRGCETTDADNRFAGNFLHV